MEKEKKNIFQKKKKKRKKERKKGCGHPKAKVVLLLFWNFSKAHFEI